MSEVSPQELRCSISPLDLGRDSTSSLRGSILYVMAETVGAGINNYHTLSTILLRVVGLSPEQLTTVLNRNGGNMPATQVQYDEMVRHLRTMGHVLENVRGNVHAALRRC